MKSKRKTPAAPSRDIKAEMVDLFRERGAQTETDLIRAGFTKEQIETHAPGVAEQLRAQEFAAAA
ncbi:hypothetical protein E0H64_17850 [Rhizobium leguminosarum bv. viciae]|uniref:hypothetical protein n=1 Tax=Rhizobium TaxID=379 RepID=UPI00103EABE9|nr:hypothetical protein [Rhizobium leguminosarum]TBZ67860.1 hypothetical protein E0H64_17850 [Rhizobium leguminosarum bv. viciae]